MRNIQWLKDAENELVAIVDYVFRNHGESVALQVYDDIISRVDMLIEFPEAGTLYLKHQFKNKSLRVLHSKHIRIFYYFQDSNIVVVLLWDNRMDEKNIEKILSNRE